MNKKKLLLIFLMFMAFHFSFSQHVINVKSHAGNADKKVGIGAFSLTICDHGISTWTEDVIFVDDVRICSKSTLIIQSKVEFVSNGKIIVERGARLILDGGILTNACEELWHGIQVLGTPTAGQNPADQGYVQIINGSTIENSEYGVYAYKLITDDAKGGWVYSPGHEGGIIHASNSSFLNNKAAAQLVNYNSTSVSYFIGCNFTTNDDYIGTSDPVYYARVSGMNGVDFTNCDFINATSTQQFRGIESTNSTIYVEGTCLAGPPCTSWDNGSFENLEYGIYATATTPTRYVDVRHTDFTDNYRGVYISGMTAPRVTSNNFDINTAFTHNGGYGLYLDNSTGYKVEENNFDHNGQGMLGVGLIVNNSGGDPNEIYRNWFTNLQCGMNLQGENRGSTKGLVLKCNQYEATVMDKIITWDEPKLTKAAGIAASQGSSSSNAEDMAGNLFYITSPIPDGNFDDINNEANSIIYYYPENYDLLFENVKPVDYTANVTLKEMEVFPDEWTFENGCPPPEEPGGGSGGIGETKNKMAEADQKIDSTESLLALLIDGGNTEATQTEVDNSIPPETMQVYNDLMSKSPYLSDTVVSTAIEKEDVLPGVMIRDIMVANPQTAKSEKLMEKLDERWDPLPEYMKAQILAGRSIVSIREETESRLAAFKLEKAKHFNALVSYYLTDTVNPQASIDSLVVLLQNEIGLNAKYKLAMMAAERGAWAEGLTILNNMPIQSDLTPTEAGAHTQFTNYYSLLTEMAQQGKSTFEVDSAQIAALVEMELSQNGMASVYARNILLALNLMEYDEPILLPDLLKSSKAMDEYTELLGKTDETPGYIKVRPNPSKDYIIVEYGLEQETVAAVVINDVSGMLKFSKNTTGKQDHLTVDTRNWKAGIYVISLKINGKLIESVTFTIID